MKKTTLIYLLGAIILFLLPLFRLNIVVRKESNSKWMADFAAYCIISRTLAEGKNPFPDHYELFGGKYGWGKTVPIIYPGQMPFFALLGYLYGSTSKNIYLLLNIIIIYYLTGLTFVKACGFKWHDILEPGRKQIYYLLCCLSFLASCSFLEGIIVGQITIVLTFLLYWLFWGPASRCMRVLAFAFIAVAKYSLLPVIAPLLFFKGHWKLCLTAFALFIFFSVTPIFSGNNLIEVYKGYCTAVAITFQPGSINHYDSNPAMCHLGFFKIQILNHFLKAIAIGIILWLFWKERKKRYVSDTLMLVGLSLTMLISYHKIYDISIVFPLFFIRLFDFAKTRQWLHFAITLLFPLFLNTPRTITFLMIPSWIGRLVPWAENIVYTYNNPWGTHYMHTLPCTPLFAIALTIWSLYLYLHVKEPYCFEIPPSTTPSSTPR